MQGDLRESWQQEFVSEFTYCSRSPAEPQLRVPRFHTKDNRVSELCNLAREIFE